MANINENGVKCRITAMETRKAYAVQTIANIDIQRMSVLEIEKNEQAIFDMASTGFASTVRLAKSAANTWTPIFLENKTNIIKSLDEYIKNLKEFKSFIETNDNKMLDKIINSTNYNQTVLDGIKQNKKE